MHTSTHNPSHTGQPASDPTLEALRLELTLWSQLAELAQAQHEAVEQGNSDRLLSVLASRQRLVDRLCEHQTRTAQLRSAWGAHLGSLAPAQRQQAVELARQLQSLADAVRQADERDTRALADQRQDVVEQLASLRVGSSASRAYGPDERPMAMYQDTHA